jgi:hypothetical protein
MLAFLVRPAAAGCLERTGAWHLDKVRGLHALTRALAGCLAPATGSAMLAFTVRPAGAGCLEQTGAWHLDKAQGLHALT